MAQVAGEKENKPCYSYTRTNRDLLDWCCTDYSIASVYSPVALTRPTSYIPSPSTIHNTSTQCVLVFIRVSLYSFCFGILLLLLPPNQAPSHGTKQFHSCGLAIVIVFRPLFLSACHRTRPLARTRFIVLHTPSIHRLSWLVFFFFFSFFCCQRHGRSHMPIYIIKKYNINDNLLGVRVLLKY